MAREEQFAEEGNITQNSQEKVEGPSAAYTSQSDVRFLDRGKSRGERAVTLRGDGF